MYNVSPMNKLKYRDKGISNNFYESCYVLYVNHFFC